MSTHASLEHWPITRPTPYARNARLCPEPAIAKVAGSIHEYGFRSPILVDEEGVIIAGHTRLAAAQRLGLETVPVIVCHGLTPAQVKAYRLADNRTAQETTWDDELLAIELEELLGLDVDLVPIGFDPDEVDALLSEPTDGLTDPDDVPAPPEQPVTRTGDLWILGEHRLLCGDSTDEGTVARVMASERAVLMATDPPYLVDYDGSNHLTTKGGVHAQPAGLASEWDKYEDHESGVAFYRDFIMAARQEALIENPAVYQWFAGMRADIVFAAWREAGLLPHQLMIWKKSRGILTHCHYLWDYEPFMYGWVQGHKPSMRPPAGATATWEVGSAIEDNPGSVHPTMKPVELTRRCIDYHTKPGQLIYEPFSGSGTALIAAEETGRRCRAIELSPAFVDVAAERWERFSGGTATLEGDGRSFAEVAGERGG